jgi:DNA ligase-1
MPTQRLDAAASLPFVEVVETSATVAATRSRTAKIEALSSLLGRVPADEISVTVALLIGEPRQGKVGVGWATLAAAADRAGPAAQPTLTVADIDHGLTTLADFAGAGSGNARSTLITDLLGRATADEATFLRALLVGELRQGALAGVMADAVARAAAVPASLVRRAAMLAGDLPHAAAVAIVDGAEGLAAIGLRLLHPIQPMLAATSANVADAIAAAGRSSVEWKLDGARIQVHREGDAVAVFTRNLNDVTPRLGGIVDLARSFPARAFVLDGEVLGLADDERPESFQDSMSRFGREDGEAGAVLVARFFDCLHLDGHDLLDEPLHARRDALERVAGTWCVPAIVTDDVAIATQFFDDTVAAGHEGVMIKALDSPYEAGRRGGSWRKVKPVHTLDLVVLAAEWGHGRRRGWLSNLHLGARDPAGGFVMVGKTFKGLTDELLGWQTEQFLARKLDEAGGVVTVTPELVVEIAIDGVQVSPRYSGGVALRFARVRRYRPDKTADEADTIDAVRTLLPAATRR